MSKKDIKKKNISANATNDSDLENVSGGQGHNMKRPDLYQPDVYHMGIPYKRPPHEPYGGYNGFDHSK